MNLMSKLLIASFLPTFRYMIKHLLHIWFGWYDDLWSEQTNIDRGLWSHHCAIIVWYLFKSFHFLNSNDVMCRLIETSTISIVWIECNLQDADNFPHKKSSLKYLFLLKLQQVPITFIVHKSKNKNHIDQPFLAQVSFSDRPLSVVCLLYIYNFNFFSRNAGPNFNQTWQKSFLGKRDWELYKWKTAPFPKGRY
jgi:hypothetical protein